MENPIVYCYTATGNSYAVAKAISHQIRAELLPITHQIPETRKPSAIGFVFPTFFMGLPGIVEEFVRKISIDGNPYLFGITTSGPMPGDSLGHLNRILLEKGKSLHYSSQVRSVANYIAEYNVRLDKTASIIESSKEKTNQIAQDIVARKTVRTKGKEGIPSHIFHKLYIKNYPIQDQYFTVSDTCIGCGLCKKVCLADNIEIQEKKPMFHGKCENCMACIHWCPTKAIQWKTHTQKRNRYHHPDVSAKELAAFKLLHIIDKQL